MRKRIKLQQQQQDTNSAATATATAATATADEVVPLINRTATAAIQPKVFTILPTVIYMLCFVFY